MSLLSYNVLSGVVFHVPDGALRIYSISTLFLTSRYAQRHSLLREEDGILFRAYQCCSLIGWSVACMITRGTSLTPGCASLGIYSEAGNVTQICGMVIQNITFRLVGLATVHSWNLKWFLKMHSIWNAPRFLSFCEAASLSKYYEQHWIFAYGGYVIRMKNDKL